MTATTALVTLPDYSSILAARDRIKGHAVVTPLLEYNVLNDVSSGRILLKAESLQRVGAFKFRGAYNKISQVDFAKYPGGVVACSSGNHAQGVAAAAAICGMKAAVVMPADSPALKIKRTKALGGEVILYDRATEDRDAIARAACEQRNAAYVHPYDDAQVIAGQGTVGLELMEQAADVGATPDVVLVPTSGGGLISGVSLAVRHARPDTEIYGVEPSGFDDFGRSLASGKREANDKASGSICDALQTVTPGEINFAIARHTVTGGLVVTDDEAAAAVRFAFEELKLVLEPGGAVALAAVLSGKIPTKGATVAIVLSGGNIDPSMLAQIIQGA